MSISGMDGLQLEVFLTSTQLEKSASIEDVLSTLRSSQQQLAFFDSPLTGYVHIPRLENESINDLHATLTTRGKGEGSVNVARVPLESPEMESSKGALYRFHQLVQFPKIKLDDPVIEVTITGSMMSRSSPVIATQTLRSGYPADRRNLLSGLAPIGGTSKSVLLDSLIKDNKADIIPDIPKEGSPESDRESSTMKSINVSVSIPIIRLLNIRIRNSRISKSSILSTIDLESSSKAKELGVITSLISVHHGFQRTTHPRFSHEFPIEISGEVSYSFTYLLESHDPINYKSLITMTYSCDDHIATTKLMTNVDFITPFAPLNRSLTSSNPNITTTTSLQQLHQQQQQQQQQSSLASCLTVKFVGSKSVTLGSPFKLTLQVYNITRKPRNLVMTFTINPDTYTAQLPKIKSLVLPQQTVLKQYATSRLKPVGLLALDNEIHLKAEAGAVFETEIRFVGLEMGVTALSGASITDIATGETMSCDRLLEVIVE
ncbi:CYFA0S01e02696g1_1 [Cyberlindnera fabianii]|uniref:CYFA0S01e02696g1_1 n=1 Tax=Cyberlindnera fabianii TaxID=36022 RepID=A0A061APD0_CYBFA|nr:CYFA0S01e02696g1_1 [Cyberlindnera fabianii]